MINSKYSVLLTGFGKGIGREILLDCIKSKAYVIGITRSKDDLKGIKVNNKKTKFFFGDVTDDNLIDKVFEFIKKNKIRLNGLINNAGIRYRKKFENISKKDLETVLENNFISPFLIIQKFYKNCDKSRNCSIVNIGSIVGERGFDELSAYGASKSAINGLTKCLMVEFSNQYKNIRINSVNPGFTKTSFYKKFKQNKKLHEWTLNKTPLKKWATTKEISNLVMFLLSEKSSYINGQSINIDGGWTSQ